MGLKMPTATTKLLETFVELDQLEQIELEEFEDSNWRVNITLKKSDEIYRLVAQHEQTARTWTNVDRLYKDLRKRIPLSFTNYIISTYTS